MSHQAASPVVAIIGGGFSGAALAVHLRLGFGHDCAFRTVVFEPRECLGAGLAYSTLEAAHRINVPAGRMALYPDRPESFLDFIAREELVAIDVDCVGRDGLIYARRSDFGAYVAGEVKPYLERGDIEHRRVSVVSIHKHGNCWHILGSDGATVVADVVAIAVSHPSPALPAVLARVAGNPKLVRDVTKPDALAGISSHDRVLILGNGLTSADVVASLSEKGHRGQIVSISRRGLRSKGHPATVQEPYGDFVSSPSAKTSQLLRDIRLTLKEAGELGLTWHAVIDALRMQGQSIWRALSLVERRRIARLARPYWDVHRFRIAPQVEDVLDRAIADGRLAVKAASLRHVELENGAFKATLRERGRVDETTVIVDAIVVTTGPAHGGILASQPFLAGLHSAGLLAACDTGLGLACSDGAQALGTDSRPVEGLFVVGPLARGTFGELMGLPQVTEHAVFVADRIGDFLKRRQVSAPLKQAV